ncbi:DNA-binding transcriptional regulator [Acrasis kona]|uniref:DNA-binding transcriptional regulator n=1 Tax=Acrasis kona TaxID=1008807 RepID=A0AAW2YH46_9EUKA
MFSLSRASCATFLTKTVRAYHVNRVYMAGHSKWANIKHKKAKTDAQKMKQFGKLSVEISAAVRAGGPDPSSNAALKFVLDRCKKTNMPKEAISKALSAGSHDGVIMEHHTYEGNGPNRVAFVINCLTDKKHRTIAELKSIFTKNEGVLLASKVAFLFEKIGIISFKMPFRAETEEQIEEVILDQIVGDSEHVQDVEVIPVEEAEAVEDQPSGKKGKAQQTTTPAGNNHFIVNIVCDPDRISSVNNLITPRLQEHFQVKDSTMEVTMFPKEKVDVDEDKLELVNKLIDQVEDHPDVISFYHNADI